MVGDLKTVLTDLIPMVDEYEHEEWMEQIGEWKAEGDARSIMSLAGRRQTACVAPGS